jgi:hypothetical protein
MPGLACGCLCGAGARTHSIHVSFVADAVKSTQQIAGYLIIYRLADGSAWRAGTLRDSSIVRSGLQFGSVGGDDVSPVSLRQHLDVNVIRGGDTR